MRKVGTNANNRSKEKTIETIKQNCHQESGAKEENILLQFIIFFIH
jgi:hypothetical protein